jgi:hypothetical protein
MLLHQTRKWYLLSLGRFSEDEEKLILGISATHLFEWNGEELTVYQPIDGGWQPAGTAGNGAVGEGGIEIAVPLDELGALTPGSDLQILVLQYSEDVFIPARRSGAGGYS